MQTSASTFVTHNEKPETACVGRGLTSPELAVCGDECKVDTLRQNIRRRLFNRFSILRSSPFRLGLLFWMLFTSCFGLGLLGFYETLQGQLLKRIDSDISVHFQNVLIVYAEEGIDEVVRVAEKKASSPMVSLLGFHLSTLEGERIAGNVPSTRAQSGWQVLTGEDLGMGGDDSFYRFYTSSFGGYVLSIGKSLDDLVQLRHIALTCVLWMLAISTVLSLCVALMVAQRVRKRMVKISTAMNEVAAGNLLSRLPVTSAGDDVDILSDKINSSLDRLQLTVDGMRQVSTDIAHDLKTPLNRLFIIIDEASTKSRAGHCVGDDLEVALDEAHAINGTFEALLRIAQIEAGARKSQFKSVDVTDVLETAVEVYSAVVEENGQSLKMDIQPGKDGSSLPVFGDRNLLMQMVVNLIENSVNHCEPGTHIAISGYEDEEGVCVSVSDSGPGIPEAERGKVFERLYRLERSRTNKGTGLGLSMVKAIVDLHGGAISLHDNAPGLITKVNFGHS